MQQKGLVIDCHGSHGVVDPPERDSPKQSGSLWYLSPSKQPRALHVANSSQFIMHRSTTLRFPRGTSGSNYQNTTEDILQCPTFSI